jgi:hypothetical protein
MEPKAMFKRTLFTALLFTLTLNACGGGSSSSPATGDVAVVITDGPTDQYERMLVTITGMTLIGSGGQVELYAGPPLTFDLLQMSEWADLAFTTEVLAGKYNKIRLELSQVELIDLADSTNNVVLSKLPANGKIDLNPRGSFEVSPDFTTVIKLDIDAKRSFQVVETGNKKLQLRPVIFVDVYQDDLYLPDRLVRIAGDVQADSITGSDTDDLADDSFRLCDLQFISQSSGPSTGSSTDCVRVYADSTTSFFDEMGAATDFSAITEGESLTAVGFITDSDDGEAVLGLNSVVQELGPRQTDSTAGWDTLQGLVADDPVSCDSTDQCFNFVLAGTDPVETVATRMQPETRVFRADGFELSQADVSTGDSGSVDAVLSGTELQAALLVLSTDVGGSILAGTLDSVSDPVNESAPYILTVMSDAGGQFEVCATPDTTVILQVLVVDETVTLFDLLDPGVLDIGSAVEVFGNPDALPAVGCDINAEEIIVEAPPAI